MSSVISRFPPHPHHDAGRARAEDERHDETVLLGQGDGEHRGGPRKEQGEGFDGHITDTFFRTATA